MAKYILRNSFTFIFIFCTFNFLQAQILNKKKQFTHQDTLRGTLGPERTWWNVSHYDITINPDYNAKSISGKTVIEYKVIQENHSDYMQIDLQQPLTIDELYYDGKLYINYPAKPYYNEGNVWHIPLPKAALNSVHKIGIVYHGNPRIAINPPWDGGWIFAKDSLGRPWMTVACQGLGASVWYPCKDHQSDEPDRGATLNIIAADSLVAVGNGRLKDKVKNNDGTTTWSWNVVNPINNYDIIPYIAKYVNFTDTLMGEKGKLDLSYWVLDYNLEKAKKQFGRDVKPMLHCFEYWMGPYPFYEDGYKLVETSHLGMEHQSAVAYGNHYRDGYLGRDLSGSGWGLKWDYIIIHESGHEWFGNNITTNDVADMWIHEGFTDYTETLFVECQYGKEAADAYTQGLRRSIRNDKPIIGPYGVNQEGSGDMYNKGNNLIHTIRQVINNDELFRKILRGLTQTFYHKTVDSKDVETYISKESGRDLSKIFDQYLRTSKIPVLEYKTSGQLLSYRWTNCLEGFNMPVRLANDPGIWLNATTSWKETSVTDAAKNGLQIDKNFYITVKKAE
ncbi:MAG: M1 family metallopeptidase [Bacteroidetes bacterium]|nr:M1 family metallopeptidase [Bacteroidota bacterium]MBS1633237.1 M1 family metallopeptidase [Bacteroidota bacterium]